MIIIKRIKLIGIIALILSTMSMIFGIWVAGYYIDNLYIRGIIVALLCASNVFVANLVGLIFKEQNKL